MKGDVQNQKVFPQVLTVRIESMFDSSRDTLFGSYIFEVFFGLWLFMS